MDEDTHDVEMDALPTPDSNKEASAPVRKARATRGRPKATTATSAKAKPATRRLSGRSAVAKKEPLPKNKTATARAAPKGRKTKKNQPREEANVDENQERQESDGNETAASFDELVTTKEPVSKRGRPAKKQQEPVIQETRAVENDGEFEYTPTAVRKTDPLKNSMKQATAGMRNSSSDPPYTSKVIPETQVTPMDLDSSNPDPRDAVPDSVLQNSSTKGASSRYQQKFLSTKRTDGTSVVKEKTQEDTLTRREYEATQKFEDLDMRYKALKEVGVKEAQVNFDRLKEQIELRNKTANDLIHALKKELGTQSNLAQKSRSLQTQLTTSNDALAKAQAEVTQLSASLSQVQKENKALQAKLASSRGASITVESASASAGAARTPGSAMRNGQQRTIMIGSAEAAQAAQVALLKEDLYSDLTGLILRGVERGDEADVYDCIQTGRNGTLHFKLSIATDSDPRINYEHTTFTYTPRLDLNRDRDLIELLPDYLSEEIAFSRVNAAKFYGRVVDTLTMKRREGGEMGVEGDGEGEEGEGV